MRPKRAAPLTHELLARKGQAVSSPLEQRPAAPAPRKMKLWMFVGVGLVSATGAMAYISMPASVPETVRAASIQSDVSVSPGRTGSDMQIPPVALSPERKLIADVTVVSDPREPMTRNELLASAKAQTAEPRREAPAKLDAITVATPPLVMRARQDTAPPPNLTLLAKPKTVVTLSVPVQVKVGEADTAVAKPAKPAKTKPVAPPPESKVIVASIPRPRAAKPSPPAARRLYTIQLASLKSRAAADREWSRLKRRFAKSLGNLTPSVKKATLAKRGVFYRLRAGEIASHKRARKLCATVKAAGQSCLVVRR